MLRRPSTLLAAAGAALAAATVVAACGGGADRTFRHETFFVVTGTHQAYACEQCHDPGAPSFSVARKGVDCLTSQCHTKPDCDASHGAMSGYAYDCATCIGCHKDGKTGVIDHSFFPITGSAPHAGLRCATCHGATRAVADLQCVTCHTHDQATTDAAHQGVAGYLYASPSCYGCHKDGSGGLPANHPFPAGAGTKHAGIGCSGCHGATKALADATCIPCHDQAKATTQHAGVRGAVTTRRTRVVVQNYQYATAACLRCHADAQVNRVASHPRVDHGIGGDHGPYCLACHPSTRTDKPWGASFGSSSCLACHDSNNPG